MDFNTVKDKAAGIAQDINGGLAIMDRYVLKRDIKSRTVLTDTKNGVNLVDTEDSKVREYPLIKILFAAAAAVIGFAILVIKFRTDISRKKTIKHQKKEIKRLRKLCKDAKIDIKKKK
jgi:hypothetical protein